MTDQNQPEPAVPPSPELPEVDQVTLDPVLQAHTASQALGEMQIAQDVAVVEAAVEVVPPPEPREYLLDLDTTVLGEQLALLQAIQRRDPNPVLQGLLTFLEGLEQQAFVRYGLAVPRQVDLLRGMAESGGVTSEVLSHAVRQAVVRSADQVNDAGVSEQIDFLVEHWGVEQTRQFLQSASAANKPPDDQT